MFEYTSKLYFHNGLKIKIEEDFLNYYYWHLLKSKHSTLGLSLPKYKNHISIILPKIHGKTIVEKSKKYVNELVTFTYTGEIIKGGTWFENYWLKIQCDRVAQIKQELGVVEKNFLGLHLTLASTKNRINELYPQALNLAKNMNNGQYNIDSYRNKVKLIINKI